MPRDAWRCCEARSRRPHYRSRTRILSIAGVETMWEVHREDTSGDG